MEFSKSYNVRQVKLKLLEVPTFAETKQQLGKSLTKVLLETCPEALKQEIGLHSKLNGPGKELWVSPSDLLITKVVLKPPLTNKHMKALTHQGILEIGSKIEDKLLNDLNEKRNKDLLEKEIMLKLIADREKRVAITETINEQEKLFRDKVMQLNDEFKNLLEEELIKLEEHLKNMYAVIMEIKLSELIMEQNKNTKKDNEAWTWKVVEDLTALFLADLKNQEKQLTDLFNIKFEKQKEKYKLLLRNEQEIFEIILKQLKHNLQCNNIANLMYTLCLERKKQIIDRQLLTQFYSEKVEDLQNSCDNMSKKITKLTKFKEVKIKECDIREECLKIVLKEFQKLINFALRASPKQAEFLLNVKKMMTFELTKMISENKPRQCQKYMQWKTKTKNELEEVTEINSNDYHNCLNEKLDSKKAPLKESLTSFTLSDKHLYIREDIRDKILNDITVKPNSMIWNKDAEHLMELMKTINTNGSENTRQLSNTSKQSSVHFNEIEQTSWNLQLAVNEQESSNLGILATQDSVELQKSVKLNTIQSITNASHQNKYNSNLLILAANDSLDVIKKNDRGSKIKIKSIESVHKPNLTNTLKLSEEGKEVIEAEKFSISKPENSMKTISCDTIKLKEIHTFKSDEIISNFNSLKTLPAVSDSSKRCGRLLKNSKQYKYQPKSELSLHRDSLELIRNSRTSLKYLKGMGSFQGSVKSKTHMSIINMPPENKLMDVQFSRIATVFNEVTKFDSPWLKKSESLMESSENINLDLLDHEVDKYEGTKIIGETGKEHLQCVDSFTKDRIHSLINILKKDDSLIRIFTAGSQ